MAIFPASERTIVADTLAAPFLSICQIQSHFPDGSVLQSTGVLIGLNDVVVAGHALYSQDLGGFTTQVQVTPGLQGSHKPVGIFDATHAQVADAWKTSQDYAHDYGLLTLNQAVGASTGFLNTGLISKPLEYLDQATYTSGYAGDKGGQHQYQSDGTIDRFADGIFYFQDDLSVSGGQSGSPLMLQHASHGTLMLGLVSHENVSPSANGVMLFNQDNWAQIKSWAKDNDNAIADWQSQADFSSNQIQQVNSLYQGILGRQAEEGGALTWLQHLQQGMSTTEMVGHFLNSPEYQQKAYFEATTSHSTIEQLYQHILNRDSDAGGYAYWQQQQQQGMSLAELITAFLHSQEDYQQEYLHAYQLRYQWFDDYQLVVEGRDDNDLLTSTSQDDKLIGRGGNDYLFGGEGEDWLVGGEGQDQLVGGGGADYFQLDHYANETDKIFDFDVTADRLVSAAAVGEISYTNTELGLLLSFSDNPNSVELVGLSTTDIGLIQLDIIGG